MKRFVCLLAVLMLLLCGCTPEEPTTVPTEPTVPTTPAPTVPKVETVQQGRVKLTRQRQFHHVVIQCPYQSVKLRIGLLYRLDMQPARHDICHFGTQFLEIFLIGYHFFLPFCITSKPSLPFSSCFLQNGYLYTYCNLYTGVFQLYLRFFPLPGTHSVVY